MRQNSRFTAVLLILLLAVQGFDPLLWGQAAPLTPQELDQLLSPIALYPDSLLSQIMTASTDPQEILDVDNWLSQNPGLSGTALTDRAQQQGFDPAFVALVNFPQVLETMAQHIDDYAAIGQAFSTDQAAVSDSVQRLRAQAYAAGALRTNAQQTVDVQQASGQTIYVIQPANPQIVYVPVYDPTVVYVRPSGAPVGASLITFGAGVGIGVLLASRQPWGWGGWGWNWGARRVYYNRAVWGGWARPYRPPRVWYRPRPIVWSHRPGFGGNWNYRPPNYRPPRPGSRPSYGRPPYTPANRPGYRPPGNGSGSFRTGTATPRSTLPNRPAVPPSRVGTPTPNRQQPSRPFTTNRPTRPPTIPKRPATPGRPMPQNRQPQQHQHSAPRSAPQPKQGSKPHGEEEGFLLRDFPMKNSVNET